SVQPSQSKARYSEASSSRTAHSSAVMAAGFRRRIFSPRSIGPPHSQKQKREPSGPRFQLTTRRKLLAHHVAEADPGLAVEPRQLHGFDRREVGRAGIDLDARQQ